MFNILFSDIITFLQASFLKSHSLKTNAGIISCCLALSIQAYANQPVNIDKKQKIAQVPFYDQKQNKKQGWRACNITSFAMVIDYFAITPKNKQETRTPDYLFKQFGIKQDPIELQAMFNKVAQDAGSPIRDVFYENGTIEQLRKLARNGHPTIIHGWFTKSGHIMVITGFDGENYIVNDPYGKWLGKKWAESSIGYNTNISGKALRYEAKAFELAINDNGNGDDLWLHTFIDTSTDTEK
ncbi:C39 family peptidase [Colwellia sp. RSH04]|uniref:C39 family peptidase n=1 Tax=Colwellia sp. RSH04 TaxID=2305464 RepID=UPI000E58663D|nr:C39 family peptidase [Colwellia sp. RSH04]RHW76498.1 peptidoglycan-binding protein [Colwellia sp. RSH04]